MKNKNFVRKKQAIYISPNKKSTRIIKTLMDFFFFIKVKIKMVCFSVPSPDSRGWIDLSRNLWILTYAYRLIYDIYKNRRQAFRPPPFHYYFFLATMRYLWIVPSTFPVSSIILCIFRSFSKHLSTEKPGNSHSII